jgi:hypothetical protein
MRQREALRNQYSDLIIRSETISWHSVNRPHCCCWCNSPSTQFTSNGGATNLTWQCPSTTTCTTSSLPSVAFCLPGMLPPHDCNQYHQPQQQGSFHVQSTQWSKPLRQHAGWRKLKLNGSRWRLGMWCWKCPQQQQEILNWRPTQWSNCYDNTLDGVDWSRGLLQAAGG